MARRSILVAVILFCTALDFSHPGLPGVFQFDLSSSVESIHTQGHRTSSAAIPVMVRASGLFASVAPHREALPRIVPRRSPTSLAHFPPDHPPREGLAPLPTTEDPH